MSNPYKTKEFLELFKQWNKKLESDGLKAIENFSLPDPALIYWHSLRFRDVKEEEVYEVNKYYELALDVLERYPFKNPAHRNIWELHCEGFSIREITEKLKKHKKSWVSVIVLTIQKESGIGNKN